MCDKDIKSRLYLLCKPTVKFHKFWLRPLLHWAAQSYFRNNSIG